MDYVKYIAAFSLLFWTTPVQAQNTAPSTPDTNAMQYFINNKAKADTSIKTPKASDFIQSQSTAKQDAPPASNDTSKEAATAAWNRYKALAAGTYRAPNKTLKKVKTPEKPEIQPPKLHPLGTATQQPTKKAGGLQGLLEQYNQSKEKRGHLNTITINKPSVEAPKPPADP